MTTRTSISVRHYCGGVFVAGLAAVGVLAAWLDLSTIPHSPLTFGLLTAGVILAETLPVKIPRRGHEEEITLSTSFTMALLLVGGLGPAIIAQGVASVIQDVMSGKPAWRIRFNLGQYILSLCASYAVLSLLSVTSQVGSSHPFTGGQLPAVLLSSAAFFVVNTGLVGTAVALYQGVSLRRYFRQDLSFVVTTAGVLLLLAPIVIATTAYSPLLVPLFAGPILVIHQALRAGARSQHAARHDPLTGLPNRGAFQEAVETAIEQGGSTACVLLMDLDRFKEVNDTLGHHYGDLLLQQVAQRLRDQLRSGDRIARLGGDEFAIVSEDCSRADGLDVARRVADCLGEPFQLEDIAVDVQASVGIASFPEDGSDVTTLLQRADVAMYRAKETRSSFSLYDERHDDHSLSKLALTSDLRAAIHDGEIVAYYQPELDLRTGEVFAVEALVRWRHPQRGLLAPETFLAVAEHTNLIKPLTERVLGLALQQVVRCRDHGIQMTVAVNISTAVLIDERFTASVTTALQAAGVSPGQLKLEVTESTLMADPRMTRTILQKLHAMGIAIAIDDFGTGYSSLAYLADLPVSEIKIDRSFVGRTGQGSKEAIIVDSTIDLAHHLGLRAIAEGVEHDDAMSRLRSAGCDAAQGYVIAPPLPDDELINWLLNWHAASDAERRQRTAAWS
jgi:diguanylate cyclase (GGDEF)-like protein